MQSLHEMCSGKLEGNMHINSGQPCDKALTICPQLALLLSGAEFCICSSLRGSVNLLYAQMPR